MNNMNNVYNQGLTHEQKVVYICEHEQKNKYLTKPKIEFKI